MSAPRLSVVLVTPDRFETLSVTLRHLGVQSIADRLEIVVVAPETPADFDTAALEAFHSHRVVEIGTLRSNAHGLASGARAAAAPVVVFGEDHCLPAPGWAEALVRAHEDGHAVVGPAFRLANPETATSVADFIMTYGPWLHPAAAGERDHLPGHNSSYKRDVLLACGDDLERRLEAESLFHWDLRSGGRTLYLESAATVYHFNFSRTGPLFEAAFYLARAFAGNRFERGASPALRRVMFAAGTPLLPIIRFRRLVADLRRLPMKKTPRILATVASALVVSAVGEAMGYALGPGDAAQRVSEFEYDRARHMTIADRERLREARFYP